MPVKPVFSASPRRTPSLEVEQFLEPPRDIVAPWYFSEVTLRQPVFSFDPSARLR
jgi:hypothetical protein